MFLRDVVFLGRLVSGSVDTERGAAYLAGLSSPFQPVAERLLAAAPKSASRSGKTSLRGGHGPIQSIRPFPRALRLLGRLPESP